MLADIIQNPLYITATCVLYTKHYITNCCTGYLITGTSGPGDGSNEGIPLCIHFEMIHKCFSNPIPGGLVCNDHSLKMMMLACVCISAHVHVCLLMCVCLCMCVRVHMCVRACVCLQVCLCISVCVRMCMHARVYV